MVNRLPDLDFLYEIDFKAPEDIFPTSNAMLHEGFAMASLSLIKHVEPVRSHYMEWLESYIEVTVIEPEHRDQSHVSQDHLAEMHNFLRKTWQSLLNSKGLDENEVRLMIQGDYKNLTLKVESVDEENLDVELLVEFYLSITRQDRRTTYGQSSRF